MKLRWDPEYNSEILEAYVNGYWCNVAQIDQYGDWWEVSTDWAENNIAPDGARFLSKRAAQLYTRKHAMLAIIGGYKP